MTSPSKKNWPMFTCSYRYKGSEWSFEFPAEDFEDANARLAALTLGAGKVDGILKGTIPASLPAGGLLVRAIVFLRNHLLPQRKYESSD